MNKLLIFISFILYASISLKSFAQPAATIVKGIVYEDINKNSLKDRNEKGVPNVAVSNGTDVVLTDLKGQYQLPVSNDNIIFVIKPSGYTVPVNEFNQPRFYYIHKPNGSPKLIYTGVSPTGALPKSVNFPLIPITPKDSFKILVFGDPQPYTDKEVDFFYRGIVSELENTKDAVFGISMGDLVGDSLDLHLPYIKAIKHVGIPWYNVMGNHDENYDVNTDSLSDETFEKNFGPANFAFNHGMVHFIILDDVLYPDPRDHKGYWGGFRKDQLRFIENDLKFVPKDHLIVLAFHIPISEREKDLGDPFRDEDRVKLFELLKDYPYTLSLSAHTHFQSQDFLSSQDGWLQSKPHHHYNVGTTCGDWYSGRIDEKGVPISTMRDGTPKGYAWLSFNKNKYVIDYKVAGKPEDYRFNIYAPKVVGQYRWSSAGVFVNFFMGSENDSVFYRIDNGDWHKMKYTPDYDPAYLQQWQEWDLTDVLFDGRRPSNPVACTHLWRGNLPTNISAGEHTIEIKAYDMFGRAFTQKRNYNVVARH